MTNDMIALKNASAIARSIRNIVMTAPGEKFFDPNFGSRISQLLFENLDIITAVAVKDEIENSIRNYEPRVILDNVLVKPDFDNNSYDATVIYRIVGIDVPTQELEFVLQSTR